MLVYRPVFGSGVKNAPYEIWLASSIWPFFPFSSWLRLMLPTYEASITVWPGNACATPKLQVFAYGTLLSPWSSTIRPDVPFWLDFVGIVSCLVPEQFEFRPPVMPVHTRPA